MSIKDFIKNPLSYTKSHVVQFTHGAFPPSQVGMQVAATMNNWGGAWTAEHHTMIPGQYTNFRFLEAGIMLDGSSANQRIGKGSDAIHTVVPFQDGIDHGIRYLPWRADAVTYMSLDGAAKTFFTGPLSGCSIFIGKSGGTYWAFHANRNSSGTSDNAAVKASMTTSVVTRLAAPVPIVCEAIYGRDYKNFGFVFGQVSSGKWSFYAADTKPLAKGGGHAVTTVRKLG